MDKILEKLFTKYFIYKVQVDWKDELKKIPEELLKKWMDDELFVKIKSECENMAADVISDIDRKWDNEIWMDINDFVNEYNTDLEIAEEAKAEKGEDYWDSEDEEDLSPFMDDKNDVDVSTEVKLMYCPEADVTCDCDHQDPHLCTAGCFTGCLYEDHDKCGPYIEQDQEEKSLVTDDDVPDEIVETGGL